MVEFVHPFPGRVPGDKISKQELISALRLAICAEEEATHLYDTIAEFVDDENVVKIMLDVANEEQIHIGEFQKLLELTEADEVEKIEKGKQEAEEKLNKQSNELSEDEVEQILRVLVGGAEQRLCKIKQFSKEWNALNYALKLYKKERGINIKKGLYEEDAIKIIEQFLEDPERCDTSNLREAIGRIWEFMERRIYGSIISSLRKLAHLLK